MKEHGRIPLDVIVKNDLSGRELVLLLWLQNKSHSKGKSWHKMSTIAEELGYSVKETYNLHYRLKKRGLIERKKEYNEEAGRFLWHTYLNLVPKERGVSEDKSSTHIESSSHIDGSSSTHIESSSSTHIESNMYPIKGTYKIPLSSHSESRSLSKDTQYKNPPSPMVVSQCENKTLPSRSVCRPSGGRVDKKTLDSQEDKEHTVIPLSQEGGVRAHRKEMASWEEEREKRLKEFERLMQMEVV